MGRTRSWITRLTLIGAPLVLIGGVAYSCGVSTGSARLVQSSTISADDASAFHLNSFPGRSRGGFRCLLPVAVLDSPGRCGHHRNHRPAGRAGSDDFRRGDPGMWVDRIHAVEGRRWR